MDTQHRKYGLKFEAPGIAYPVPLAYIYPVSKAKPLAISVVREKSASTVRGTIQPFPPLLLIARGTVLHNPADFEKRRFLNPDRDLYEALDIPGNVACVS